MPRSRPEAISPTAHYTGTVWLRHGLSHPAFGTVRGHAFYYALKAPLALSGKLGGPTLESFLLARHRIIDLQLEQAIENGEITQVVEIAAGLSPRGWRFAERYKDRITYVEADLPDMAAYKRKLLVDGGLDSENHHICSVNALSDDGPDSLAELVKGLDPERGLAIITEGLINYFDSDAVIAMWRRFAQVLKGFRHGLYLSDLHVRSVNDGLTTRAFMDLLSSFVRGRVHLHFDSETEACEQLLRAGFDEAQLLDPRSFRASLPDCRRSGAGLVRVVSARTGI